MKGLLIKDCLLLKNIRKVFLFMILSACFCSLAMQDKNFIGGYLMVFFGTVCLSSISYDEMDQGNLTIFSFPIERKTYVQEKYVYGLLLLLSALLLSTLFLLPWFSWKSIASNMIMLGIGLLFLAVSLPFQLKYGHEKGRLVMLLILMILAGGLVVIDMNGSLKQWLETSSLVLDALIYFGFVVFAYIISLRISISIMEKKEF